MDTLTQQIRAQATKAFDDHKTFAVAKCASCNRDIKVVTEHTFRRKRTVELKCPYCAHTTLYPDPF